MAKNATRGAARRNLVRLVQNFSEDDAERFLAEIRFGSKDQQVCPACGVLASHYRIPARRQWRCREISCAHTFSVTSGTRLDNHKLTFRQILRLLLHAEACPKGTTLLATSNAVCITEKCSAQNLMKIREAVMENPDAAELTGTIHMDGAWVAGKFRRSNRRVKSCATDALRVHGTTVVKKRLRSINPTSQANQRRAKNKRVMMAMVEVDKEHGGARRVVVAMCRSENANDATVLAKRNIAPGSVVFTDENPAYNELGASFEHHSVNHSEEYSTVEGVSDNMAESFFSRVRRSEYGVHHGFRPQHLALYAHECAWRETTRHQNQASRVTELASWLLAPGYSCRWRGYHGGRKRRHRRNPRPEIVMGSSEVECIDARRLAGKGAIEESAVGDLVSPTRKA